MPTKRKGEDYEQRKRPEKKAKQEAAKQEKNKLVFEPRPEWHTVELPVLSTNEVKVLPQQDVVNSLHEYATDLLRNENVSYTASHMAGSSSHKFMSTIMASGTLEDKISALTLMVQESPMHTMQAFDNLLALAKKRSRNQALMAVAALKDLLGQGVVLPGDRKLRSFGKQPGLLSTIQDKKARWAAGESLPGGLDKRHLMLWAYEDWLKRKIFELLKILETWCNDEVEYARSRAITYVFELLRDKPEQEENLLRLLINKLGDKDRKIASRASYLPLQLENTHPAMRMIIVNSIESDCLFRPGQSLHAKYYAVITLNQTILTQKEEAVANKLLEIYFSLFVQLLKPAKDQSEPTRGVGHGKPQGGGGTAGKMAAKKRKAVERSQEAEVQTTDKLMSQVLTGVNRAFPFADTNAPGFEKQIDTIFRVAHSSNFNTAIQALMLIQQISFTKHYGADRFYRTLYESLLDPRIYDSSKQVMYLNLLYKSLKADVNAKRVQAFAKRLLQIVGMHEPAFACGVLCLISELEKTFPSIRNMITEPEIGDEDEEEHFVDVPEGGSAPMTSTHLNGMRSSVYDPRKRDPEHSHADKSCLWELLPSLQHFHPSVALFATSILSAKAMPPKPDPQQHSLMHFLDRFVYRNAKTKTGVPKGASIMQPMSGSSAADLFVTPGEGAARAGVPVNSEAFWAKKVEDVAADEVFFHSYFSQAGKKSSRKEKKAARQRAEDESDEGDDEAEDEIWKAIAQSKPDVEGPDDDDDLSFGDLEDLSGSDAESEPGIDLGGGDEAGNATGEAPNEDDFAELGEFPELESDEDALLDSDEDVDVDIGEESPVEEEGVPGKRKQQTQKKKLKALPTFASVDDYAKLLADEPDDM